MNFFTLSLLVLLALAGSPAHAQGQFPEHPQNPSSDQPPARKASPPGTQVLFSRFAGSPGANPARPARSGLNTPDLKATDAERTAVLYRAYDLELHLALRAQSLAARARITVVNNGAEPLRHLPLQLSSTLSFESVSLDGTPLAFSRQVLSSDADHTGQLNEAVILLPQPLAPGAAATFAVNYSGTLQQTTKRLEQIGTPADIAAATDWDTIGEEFTGLRGFGSVVWYPVSSVPVLLEDGASVFREAGRQMLLNQDATVALHITAEYFANQPTIAVLDGVAQPLAAPAVTPTAAFPGILHAGLPPTRLGSHAPSLFLAVRAGTGSGTLRVWSTPEDSPDVPGYLTAATMVEPLIDRWLGPPAGSIGSSTAASPPFTVLGLPHLRDATNAQEAAAEQGATLFTPLELAEPARLAGRVAHGLAHARFHSPHVWLDEGVATFLGSLWVEQTQGRDRALELLESGRGALALAEPASPAAGAGQPLSEARDAVYYRVKANYVLWMLRDLAGDQALARALQLYRPADDTTPDYFETLLESAIHPGDGDGSPDLHWFFDDWVLNDRGLPDLSIAGIYPSPAAHPGQFLVAVDLANDGYAAAAVPLTVRSRKTSITLRVKIPARTRLTHRLLLEGEPVEVQLNDGTVPEVAASIHRKTIQAAATP